MEKLRARRLLAGLSQAELAEVLGVSRTTVTMWETTKSRPNVDMLPAIAKTLGCSIDELFSNEEKEAG